MMFFGLFAMLLIVGIPVLLIVLLAGGGANWLKGQRPAPVMMDRRCEQCGQFLQADWKVCPYCSTAAENHT